jgi:hypothetical protein
MKMPEKCKKCIEPEETILSGLCKKSVCEKYKGQFRGCQSVPKWVKGK